LVPTAGEQPAAAADYYGRTTTVPPGQAPRRPLRESAMDYQNDEWQRRGATLSDKTASQEFGLTPLLIIDRCAR
jgi:hypothetical protein